MTAVRLPHLIAEQLLQHLLAMPADWHRIEVLERLDTAQGMTRAELRAALTGMCRAGQLMMRGPQNDREYALPGADRTAQAVVDLGNWKAAPTQEPPPAQITKARLERTVYRVQQLLAQHAQVGGAEPMTISEMAAALQLEHKDVLLAVMDAAPSLTKTILGDGTYGYGLKQRPETVAATMGPIAQALLAGGLPRGPFAESLTPAKSADVDRPLCGCPLCDPFTSSGVLPASAFQEAGIKVGRVRHLVERSRIHEPLLTAAARADEAFLAYLNTHPDPQLAALARASHALWRACAAAGVLQ